MGEHGRTRTDADEQEPGTRTRWWLGGSACAGKSSVARLLAERYGFAVYALDDQFPRHRERASPDLHPGFCALMDLPPEKLWEGSAVSQTEALLAFHRDQLALTMEDLAGLGRPVIVEGVGVLPELLPQGARAAFLVADPVWRREIYPRRGDFVRELLSRCPDPEAAFERWMERDDRVALHVAREAERRGFPCLTVGGGGGDGGRSLAEVAAAVVSLLHLGEEDAPASGDAPSADP